MIEIDIADLLHRVRVAAEEHDLTARLAGNDFGRDHVLVGLRIKSHDPIAPIAKVRYSDDYGTLIMEELLRDEVGRAYDMHYPSDPKAHRNQLRGVAMDVESPERHLVYVRRFELQ